MRRTAFASVGFLFARLKNAVCVGVITAIFSVGGLAFAGGGGHHGAHGGHHGAHDGFGGHQHPILFYRYGGGYYSRYYNPYYYSYWRSYYSSSYLLLRPVAETGPRLEHKFSHDPTARGA